MLIFFLWKEKFFVVKPTLEVENAKQSMGKVAMNGNLKLT